MTTPPETKRFPLRVVLTVTTGRLLTVPKGDRDNGIGDLYEILNWMTGDNLFTHQLPRASNECSQFLIERFPELADYGRDEPLRALDLLLTNHAPELAIEAWLAAFKWCDGADFYDVPRLAAGEHQQIDPVSELEQMVGKDRVLVVKVKDHP